MTNDEQFPLVTIFITAYNRAKYIGRALASAQAQDYPNLEILVCDNASTDNTTDIMKEYLSDPRLRYHRHEQNLGMVRNFEYAFREARGRYVTSICSDDYLMYPEFISEAVSKFISHPSIAIVKGMGVVQYEGKESYESIEGVPAYSGLMKGKEIFNLSDKGYNIGFDGCVIDNDKAKQIDIQFDKDSTSFDFEMTGKLCLFWDVYFINKLAYTFVTHGNQESKSYSNLAIVANIRIAERCRDMAVEKNVLDRQTADQIYYNIEYQHVRYNYIKRYIQDLKNFDQYRSIVGSAYPVSFRRAEREPRIRLLRILYRSNYNFLWLIRIIKPSMGKLLYRFQHNLQ